jgi:hypothetical protein
MTAAIKLGEKEHPVPATQANVSPDPLENLPGVVQPDPFDPQLPLGGNTQVAMSFTDGTYSANVNSDNAGHKNMVVKDKTGNTIAEGLVDTEEQWAKFPADVRGHLDVMHKMLFNKVKPAR